MAQNSKPKRSAGSISWSKDGKSCRIRVARGFREDGSRRWVTKTLHDVTKDEAEAEVARLVKELTNSDLVGSSMTLDTYYHTIFRSGTSNRGKPRSAVTLAGYDYIMEGTVLPQLGSLPLHRITHEQMAGVIRGAKSPTNCKTTLRAVMLSAYNDGFLAERPFQRRILTPKKKKEQTQPWDTREVSLALKAFQDAPPEMQAYLALGLSGLRKSEALAVRPCDLAMTKLYDFTTGQETESMTVCVRRSYSDREGVREDTKNDHSQRSVPVFAPCRKMLMEIARGMKPEDRFIDMCGRSFCTKWQRCLERLGLRYVSPGTLRHTSDTMALDAGVAPDLVDKMHGRSEHTSTYKNYYRPGLSVMEEASRKVGDTL